MPAKFKLRSFSLPVAVAYAILWFYANLWITHLISCFNFTLANLLDGHFVFGSMWAVNHYGFHVLMGKQLPQLFQKGRDQKKPAKRPGYIGGMSRSCPRCEYTEQFCLPPGG